MRSAARANDLWLNGAYIIRIGRQCKDKYKTGCRALRNAEPASRFVSGPPAVRYGPTGTALGPLNVSVTALYPRLEKSTIQPLVGP